MDKKQELNPDLKEVYDRIMNTKVEGKTDKSPGKNDTDEKKGILNTTPQSSAQTKTVPTPPSSVHNESFAFSAKDHKMVSSKEEAGKDSVPGKSSGISKQIIIALLVVFFAVYIGLWAVILGLVKF